MEQNLEVVFGFRYLGLYVNYYNTFKEAQNIFYHKASRAMFSLSICNANYKEEHRTKSVCVRACVRCQPYLRNQ